MPRRYGKYAVTAVLGRGGMGAVYKAVQITLDRPVAIKVLPVDLVEDDDAQFAERFKNEARTMAKLSHPGIVDVFDFGETKTGLLYIVMEFIDGVPLDRWTPPGETLQEKRRVMLRAFAAACNGVHTAHLNGVIHRDLKPDNILVTTDGRPVVLDFGIAKAADSLAEDHPARICLNEARGASLRARALV